MKGIYILLAGLVLFTTTTACNKAKDAEKKDEKTEKKDEAKADDKKEEAKKEGWSDDERKAFMEGCVGEAAKNIEKKKAENYCTCMLDKIVVSYPNALDAEAKMSDKEMEKMAGDCIDLLK